MSSLTIAGHNFEVMDDPRFVPGATIELDAGIAATLQQVRRENLRNNFASKVKGAAQEGQELPQDKHAELQASLDDYAARYTFGTRTSGVGRKRGDPVAREALKLAREAIGEAYHAKHGKRLTGAELSGAAEQLLEARRDEYVNRARRNIHEREAAAASVLSETMAEAA